MIQRRSFFSWSIDAHVVWCGVRRGLCFLFSNKIGYIIPGFSWSPLRGVTKLEDSPPSTDRFFAQIDYIGAPGGEHAHISLPTKQGKGVQIEVQHAWTDRHYQLCNHFFPGQQNALFFLSRSSGFFFVLSHSVQTNRISRDKR